MGLLVLLRDALLSACLGFAGVTYQADTSAEQASLPNEERPRHALAIRAEAENGKSPKLRLFFGVFRPR